MTDKPRSLSKAYAEALRAMAVAEATEAGLAAAYRLGRRALADGIRIIDLALIHHAALAELVAEAPTDEAAARLERAGEFLAECLSPFEMQLSGVSEANRRLMALNADLERANIETRTAHEALKAEADERQRMQEGLWQAQ